MFRASSRRTAESSLRFLVGHMGLCPSYSMAHLVIGIIKDEPEAVLKYPNWNDELSSNMFEVEPKILQHLGSHPRIVR
jgi:hypothetical protein